MTKRVLAVGLGIAMAATFSACKQKEQQAVPKPTQTPPGVGFTQPAQPQAVPGQEQAPPVHSSGKPKGEMKVVVPQDVKGKWSAVKFSLEDKSTKNVKEITINLNSEYKIPNSNLKIVVGEFLPKFNMDSEKITSLSNDPVNPAVGIRVYEGDNQIFPAPGKQWGWLFGKMPDIHPFEHPQYGIKLKDGVKKN